jgi:molecular chaperone DnaJ
MPAKDYYLVLGVARTETEGGIRAAYRALAKRLHPDHGGEQATQAFQDINEAYEVLSDPGRRRAHNHSLRAAEERAPAQVPVRPRRARAEPLVHQAPAVSILSEPASIWPSFEALADRWFRNFTGVEGLNMDLVLTPEEAARGLALRVRVPAVRSCPACGGSGFDWAFPCALCDRQGVVQDDELVTVRIPGGARSGSVLEVPLAELGVGNLVLRFHVSVTGDREPVPLW